MASTTHRSDRRISLALVSEAAAAWALGYAIYRAYYGLGGTFGMFGVPASDEVWRSINLTAAALLSAAAVLPIVALRLWSRAWPRRILLALAWVIAVACIGHALINGITRVLSLAGVIDVLYPAGFWLELDRTAADLQDLLFNEPWFLVEGVLWAAIAVHVIGERPARRWWVGSVAAAVAAATVAGLLSAAGILGRTVIG